MLIQREEGDEALEGSAAAEGKIKAMASKTPNALSAHLFSSAKAVLMTPRFCASH
ncbi:MAG: hypothetical protein MI920_16165 [Kiloniellales bacterium]|nr:hypothetical protein [Kiloniellales bacterium]